jgi:hypothetical protein
VTIETHQAATARFYNLGGGTTEGPVPSWTFLKLPFGALNPSAWSPAWWVYDNLAGVPASSGGLLEAVGPPGYSRDFAGVLVHGDGSINVDLELWQNGVYGSPPGTTKYLGQCQIRVNDTVVWSQDQYYFNPGPGELWVAGLSCAVFVPSIDVVDGDLVRAGFFPEHFPLIYAYAAGTGEGLHMHVRGDLVAPGLTPGQPPLRLHGTVGAEL